MQAGARSLLPNRVVALVDHPTVGPTGLAHDDESVTVGHVSNPCEERPCTGVDGVAVVVFRMGLLVGVIAGTVMACGPATSDGCLDYLECLAAVEPDAVGEAAEHYGPQGTCWQQGDELADICADACAEALSNHGAAFADEPACR